MRERPQEKGGSNQDPRDRGERELVWCQTSVSDALPHQSHRTVEGNPGQEINAKGWRRGGVVLQRGTQTKQAKACSK